MSTIAVMSATAVVACVEASHARLVAASTQTAPTSREPPAPEKVAAASNGLSDLAAMTFSCPAAGLNAAAREAAKVPSQGTYQFAYFRIINDAHHAAYEVHFKSNYYGEADLKYCVALYCQQGWDPRTTKTSVTLMGNARQPGGAVDHGAECGDTRAPVNRRPKR